MKLLKCTIAFAVLLVTIACSPIENQARDTAAALQGAIIAAQAQYQSSCSLNNAQTVCQTIARAVNGQNALITSVEAYCGWNSANPPGDPAAKCVPVKSAQAGLQTSIANANQFITELKGVLK